MNTQEIIGIAGQIATWITLIIVFFTLREMGKQRKASQKPDVIFTNLWIAGYCEPYENIYIATEWGTEKTRENTKARKLPQTTVYNIGFGAAKNIKIKWEFDLNGTMGIIQDYCYKNSLPIIVSETSINFLSIELGKTGSMTNINLDSNIEKPYLLPASVTSSGLELNLPTSYLSLISILVFLKMHQMDKKDGNNLSIRVPENKINIPQLNVELEYYDIGGHKYKKKYDAVFTPIVMRNSIGLEKTPMSEPVFEGYFDYQERK